MSEVAATAIAASCASCHDCGLLAQLPASHGEAALCPRCGAELHERKPRSLERTLALVIAAIVCYVPANLLPVMTVTSLGKAESDTIFSGVIYMLDHGMWPLAIVLFTASIVITTTAPKKTAPAPASIVARFPSRTSATRIVTT